MAAHQSRLTTLGSFALAVDGRALAPPSTQKARALLTYLVMHARRDLSRERLLELLWPDAEPSRARDNLKTALWSVRRTLRDAGFDPDSFVRATKSTAQWTQPTEYDVREFEALARSGGQQAQEDAIALYGGDFLEGDYDGWATTERERLAGLFEAALSRRVGATGDATSARQLLERNPYDEPAYASLIEAELSVGRRVAAGTLYERCRSALREVGAVPSPAFIERYGSLARSARIAETFAVAFAGRTGELDAVARLCAALVAGDPGYVLLHGSAGIGKSTLLSQLARTFAERGARTVVIRGVEGDARPFGPWEDAYESATGGALRELAQRAGDATVPTLSTELLRHLPSGATIVVDDANALSGQALEVLTQVVAQSAAAGRAVIVATRPEGVERVRVALAGVRLHDVMLGPLDATGVADIVRASSGRPLHDVANALFQRTGGHPLFVAALLEELARSGAMQRDETGWAVSADLEAALRPPASLLATIETRLRSRGGDVVGVACALALEPKASVADIAGALGRSEQAVLTAVDDLLRIGDIREDDAGGFAFSHDLVRDVATRLLSAARRARLHRAFARRLDDLAPRGDALRRARHLRAAGDPLAAAAAFEKASIESLGLAAFRDAADRAREGLEMLHFLERSAERDGRLALLGRCLVGALCFGGDPVDAVPHADTAVEFARTSGNDDALTRALLSRAIAYSDIGNAREAFASAREAERIAGAHGNLEHRAKALIQICTSAMPLGLQAEAVAAGGNAYELAQRMDSDYLRATAAGQLAEACATWWRFAEAVEWAQRALDASRRVARSATAQARFAGAVVAYALECFDESDRCLERSLVANAQRAEEIFSTGGYDHDVSVYACRTLAARSAAIRGAWDASLAEVNAVKTEFPRLLRSAKFANPVRLLEVDALLGRGGADDARAAARCAQELNEPEGFATVAGWSDHPAVARARVAARFRAPEASELLTTALAVVKRVAATNPLDADWTFARLADASVAVGAAEAHRESRALYLDYRARRIAAAGPLWGGKPFG